MVQKQEFLQAAVEAAREQVRSQGGNPDDAHPILAAYALHDYVLAHPGSDAQAYEQSIHTLEDANTFYIAYAQYAQTQREGMLETT